MPDAPAEQATRRPRRTPHVVELEQRLALLQAGVDAADRRHDADVGALLRATARAEHAERLLARAVTALGQWHDDLGGLHPIAADVLVETVGDVLGLDPDQRPPRIRGRAELDLPDRTGWHRPADHPDDDEPPVEP